MEVSASMQNNVSAFVEDLITKLLELSDIRWIPERNISLPCHYVEQFVQEWAEEVIQTSENDLELVVSEADMVWDQLQIVIHSQRPVKLHSCLVEMATRIIELGNPNININRILAIALDLCVRSCNCEEPGLTYGVVSSLKYIFINIMPKEFPFKIHDSINDLKSRC